MATVAFKGTEVKTSGTLPDVGKQAPEFTLTTHDLKDVTLKLFGNKRKLLNIFPSFDTPVCAKSVRTFLKRCSSIPDLVLLNISMDLPFAASRFCAAEGIKNATTLSTFRSRFPEDYGVKIMEGPLRGVCARAVLILDEQNRVVYSQLVDEISEEPDYDEAFNALDNDV